MSTNRQACDRNSEGSGVERRLARTAFVALAFLAAAFWWIQFGNLHSENASLAKQHEDASRKAEQRAEWDDAIFELQQAIEVGSYDEGRRYRLGSLMLSHSGPDEVIRYFSASFASDPKPQTSLYFLAGATVLKNQPAEAIALYRRALEVDPAHEMSENQWGLTLLRRGGVKASIVHFERAIEIHPEFAEAHRNLAEALRKTGEDERADRHLAAAERSDPLTPRRHFYWGRALLRAGRRQAALEELERAIQLDPNDSEARNWLNRANASKLSVDP